MTSSLPATATRPSPSSNPAGRSQRGKITSGESQIACTQRGMMQNRPLPSTALVPFKLCHSWADSTELASEQESIFSPDCQLFWLKHFSFLELLAYELQGDEPRFDMDLLAVQGTLRSLLQHHSSKASILWCSAFFIVQLTSIHDHWKNHSLD